MNLARLNLRPPKTPSSHYGKAGNSLNFSKEIYLKPSHLSTKAFEIMIDPLRPRFGFNNPCLAIVNALNIATNTLLEAQ